LPAQQIPVPLCSGTITADASIQSQFSASFDIHTISLPPLHIYTAAGTPFQTFQIQHIRTQLYFESFNSPEGTARSSSFPMIPLLDTVYLQLSCNLLFKP